MPNPLSGLLKNKKLVLLAGIALVVLVIVVVVLIIFSKGCKKKSQTTSVAKVQTSEVSKSSEVSSQTSQQAPAESSKSGSAAEKPTQLAQPTPVTPSSTDQNFQAPAKKSYKWTKRRRIKDIPTLHLMLKKALDKGDEKTLNESLKSLVLQGEDVVEALKEEIINNYSRPDIRRNAIWGLFYTDNPDAIPIVKTVLKVDPDESVRGVALFVLYSMEKDDASFFEDVSKTDNSEKIRFKAQEYFRIKNINQ